MLAEDYQNFSGALLDSEKCHVCIITMETKKEVSLTYMAKALTTFMRT